MRALPILIAAALCLTVVHAMAAEPVEIATPDGKLKATLYRPQGAGPFPAVVALHACDGLGDRSHPIEPRYQVWGEKLSAAGFAVLFPDSFGSRGLSSQCRVRERTVRASRQRIADANAARHWLQAQNFVIPDRVSLLGWSHGATTALWTVRRRVGPNRDKTPDFRSAAVLYPNCRRSSISAWSARIPILILIGKSDDWTPAVLCEQMVADARGRSAGANIIVYPDAYHDFDVAGLAVHERTGLTNTPNPGGRVHIGENPQAREDAFKRVPEWFSK